jgi:hypothetical protein
MQNDLFDPPASHTCDPETSQIALDDHEASGKREDHKRIVELLVLRFPRLTAIELWDMASKETKAELVEPQEIRRRLTDLAQTGRVRQLPKRKCNVKGSAQTTWECCTDSMR